MNKNDLFQQNLSTILWTTGVYIASHWLLLFETPGCLEPFNLFGGRPIALKNGLDYKTIPPHHGFLLYPQTRMFLFLSKTAVISPARAVRQVKKCCLPRTHFEILWAWNRFLVFIWLSGPKLKLGRTKSQSTRTTSKFRSKGESAEATFHQLPPSGSVNTAAIILIKWNETCFVFAYQTFYFSLQRSPALRYEYESYYGTISVPSRTISVYRYVLSGSIKGKKRVIDRAKDQFESWTIDSDTRHRLKGKKYAKLGQKHANFYDQGITGISCRISHENNYFYCRFKMMSELLQRKRIQIYPAVFENIIHWQRPFRLYQVPRSPGQKK